MNQDNQYRYIWMCGNQLDLISSIRAYLVKHHGSESVKDMDKFFWNGAELAILYSRPLQIVITAPVITVEDAQSWNDQIQNFYEQIVRPVADKTGGVTVGLAEPGALNWLNLKRPET